MLLMFHNGTCICFVMLYEVINFLQNLLWIIKHSRSVFLKSHHLTALAVLHLSLSRDSDYKNFHDWLIQSAEGASESSRVLLFTSKAFENLLAKLSGAIEGISRYTALKYFLSLKLSRCSNSPKLPREEVTTACWNFTTDANAMTIT